MEKDIQSRSFQITLNNPEQHNVSFENFKEIIKSFKPNYFCISKEIGIKEKTPHYHAYFIRNNSAIRFSTIKRKCKAFHIEKALRKCLR